MRASEDIESDEAILSVPAEHALVVTTGGPCPKEDLINEAGWRKLPWWAQLALLLMSEKKKGPGSSLQPWIQTLPAEFPTIPLQWSDADLALLEYPPLSAAVAKQREALSKAYDVISASSTVSITQEEFEWAVMAVRSRAFSGPFEGRTAQDRLQQLGLLAALVVGTAASGLIDLETAVNGALTAAIAIPITDFLVGQTGKLKRHVLCPVVDYLNHDTQVTSDVAYEYFGDEFVVRVRGGFKAGEQVCINYGENRSNDSLLQYYGFVDRDNPHDVYALDLLACLDGESSSEGSGEDLQTDLTRKGPDEETLEKLNQLLLDKDLVWKAVSVACEEELQRRSGGEAHELSLSLPGLPGMAAAFRAEKEKVLLACKAYAEGWRGRASSAAPTSLFTRSFVLPTFQDPAEWKHAWAEKLLKSEHLEQLHTQGYCIIPQAFDAQQAASCLQECTKLDEDGLTTVTTNRCNRGCRSTWLEFGTQQEHQKLQATVPGLCQLSEQLAGIPARVAELGGVAESSQLQVHPATMVAVYPAQGAEYSLHKDSYAPNDMDPATGASRRLTVLAYFNDKWQEGDGGELKLYKAVDGQPDTRSCHDVPPKAGSLVIFDSRKVWHAVAPSTARARWAMTLWIH